MNWVKRTWSCVVVLGVLVGCSARVDPGTDGSTHWLSCNSDDECGALKCLESRCREPGTVAPSPPAPSVSTGLAMGQTCMPVEEYAADFTGFSPADVTVELGGQCASGVCLVNHFAGRLTCPYGGVGCLTPDGETVPGSILPQVEERRPENSVYCSCRCDGPDPDADYCECGAGFECAPLVPVAVEGSEPATGAYCVKVGTVFDETLPRRECDAQTSSCGDANSYSAQHLGVELAEAERETVASYWYASDVISQPLDEGSCLPLLLPVVEGEAEEGETSVNAACRVFEMTRGGPTCPSPSRLSVSDADASAARRELEARELCGSDAECATWTACEIPQITAPNSTCRSQEEIAEDGWCYVSESQGLGNPGLLESCPEVLPPSRLRFGGAGKPNASSLTVFVCSGQL